MAAARLILPIFFAMSGFLVTASMLRASSACEFLALRFVRLFPALAVVVLASAFIVGPLFSEVSAHDYFRSHLFISYLSNLLALPHYSLPGVFYGNPRHGVVNGSLWTVQAEIVCYFVLLCVASLGVLRRRMFFGIAVVLITIAVPLSIWTGKAHYLYLFPAPELGVFFLAGAALYLTRDRVILRGDLALAALATSLLLVPNATWSCLGAFPVAYFTLWLARRCDAPHLLKGDYSYALYLVAYPCEQIFVRLFPELHSWWVTAFGSLPVAFLWAFGLWHLVESPILARKHQIFGNIRLRSGAFGAATQSGLSKLINLSSRPQPQGVGQQNGP
jgi:peptidoglycan/LPS O-acetylase OafA/YrhL